MFINCVYKHEQIFIRKQLLKARGAVVSAGPILSSITWRLGSKVFINRGAGRFLGERMGMCVLSVTSGKNTSKSYNIIKDCCRPAQLGTPYVTGFLGYLKSYWPPEEKSRQYFEKKYSNINRRCSVRTDRHDKANGRYFANPSKKLFKIVRK